MVCLRSELGGGRHTITLIKAADETLPHKLQLSPTPNLSLIQLHLEQCVHHGYCPLPSFGSWQCAV